MLKLNMDFWDTTVAAGDFKNSNIIDKVGVGMIAMTG